MKENFEPYHLSGGERIVSSEIPGARSKEILEKQQRNESAIVSYSKQIPIAIKRAKGAIIEDEDGNHYIDFFSLAGVVNVGHCNDFVLEYVREQQDKLIHALDFPTENKVALIEKILNLLSPDVRDEFKVAFTGPSGSDAVEAAIKLARMFTGRQGVIAFQGSYHGMTSGALSATSNTSLRSGLGALVPDIHFIPYSYCYRCPFDLQKDTCRLQCVQYFRSLLENPHSGIAKPAAIILEPVQGEGGVVIPHDGFLEGIVQVAREHNIVVIFDEIQAGFFRTGKFLSSQHAGVVPDIYTMSKGIGGVGFPLAAIVYHQRIEKWSSGKHIGTFRGNQVSIAAGNGAFDFVAQTSLPDHVLRMESLLRDRLEQLQRRMPFIGEVRGRGLFFGIEYVKDKNSKEPDSDIVRKIRLLCFKKGLLFEIGGHYNNVIRFLPPLVITPALIERAMAIFEEVNLSLSGLHAQDTATVHK
ncbi:aspartate aminotransferase family protein [Chitinophaga qingshengii]|uniref:Aspartate aminotransferase family protein n=1 Tax=Chitinophaga qingshengii TaxID=1569794 RepID=A0ABR7TXR6_9BACT|nr:aspartate aminotransferase family protein [Chitinophaga qingshengii]MBC9934525.1 aspartate aminotransferase family protein [Chitinophaga qingshengii]